ncbi:cytidylate kinase [Firmicutes bacterium CAG:240]|jgi:cytidylate kinase|nr:(d)CMP kinase [Oscillospiraceae bacterium]OLA43248.1 MAG: cytidylate kinase [Firmicutes bacterium CAG:24053_14]CDB44388.1 cytidylate kinase [Firmicutes bacterium CAG:240]
MISIAIDGPSGAGKSTISRKAAEKFGFIYVDTGAIYRTIGLATKIRGVSLDDTAAVVALLPTLEIELKYNDAGEQHMYLDGNDVSRDIRLPEVSMLASKVSAIPAVREFLVDMQRGMAEKYDVIMDGRDIGTVILPNADLKIFLTADVRDRARRRYEELRAKGMEKPFDEVLAEMEKRDEQDTQRAAAPLKAADDAVLLDTSGNTLEESIDEVCRLISEKMGRAI